MINPNYPEGVTESDIDRIGEPMDGEISDYDKSIHSNPDAKAWSDFFNEILVKNGKQPLDPDLMLGWFANAMMAMHDHIYQVKFPAELSALKEDNNELKKLLKVLEYQDDEGAMFCPICYWQKIDGHSEDCKLNNLLNKKEGV